MFSELLKTVVEVCKYIPCVPLLAASLIQYFFGLDFHHGMSMDTVAEQFVGIYYEFCHSHRFGCASVSGSQKPNKAIYPYQIPQGKAWKWGAVKSSFLSMVQSSSPTGGKVRQLLQGAGKTGMVRGTGKWPFREAKAKIQFQSLHPALCLGEGTCLPVAEISFFFWRKSCALK